jgi:hypothetical protein
VLGSVGSFNAGSPISGLVRDGGWNYAESFAAGLFWLASNFSAKSRHAFAICNRRALSAGCKQFEASAMHCPTYA